MRLFKLFVIINEQLHRLINPNINISLTVIIEILTSNPSIHSYNSPQSGVHPHFDPSLLACYSPTQFKCLCWIATFPNTDKFANQFHEINTLPEAIANIGGRRRDEAVMRRSWQYPQIKAAQSWCWCWSATIKLQIRLVFRWNANQEKRNTETARRQRRRSAKHPFSPFLRPLPVTMRRLTPLA